MQITLYGVGYFLREGYLSVVFSVLYLDGWFRPYWPMLGEGTLFTSVTTANGLSAEGLRGREGKGVGMGREWGE